MRPALRCERRILQQRATVAYREGDRPILELLDVHRTARHVAVRALDLIYEARRAELAVRRALGRDDEHLIMALALAACGNHAHEQPEAAEPQTESFTRWTATHEWFVEHPLLQVGATSRFAAHATRLAGHDPVTSGRLVAILRSKTGAPSRRAPRPRLDGDLPAELDADGGGAVHAHAPLRRGRCHGRGDDRLRGACRGRDGAAPPRRATGADQLRQGDGVVDRVRHRGGRRARDDPDAAHDR